MSVANLVGAGVLAVLTRRRIGGIDGAAGALHVPACVRRGSCSAGVLGVDGVRGHRTSSPERAPGGRSSRCVVGGGGPAVVVYVAGLRCCGSASSADLAAPVRRLVRG